MNRFYSHFPLMMAEPGEGGSGTATDMEVDLPGGVKIKLPKADAERVIAGRQKSKEETADLNRRYGALEAEKTAAETKATEAQRAKEHAEAVKNGEIDKAREIAAKGANDRLNKLSSKYRDQALENQLRNLDGVVKEAIPDIVAQLRGSCNFNLDTESLEVMDAAGKPVLGDDGKPMQADAYVAKFLENRPYFCRASQAPGSGSSGPGKTAATGATMTASQLETMSPMQKAAFFKDGGKQVG